MIRPAYWTDADLHTRLNAEQREFYIGLWMLSDDAGYVEWDADRIGAELYTYRSRSWRSKKIPALLEVLGADHARLLDCGKHVLIPNLEKHQAPPRPSYQNRKAHAICLHQMAPHAANGRHVAPAQEGGSIGRGLEGGAGPRETDRDTEFQRLVPRPVAMGGRTA